jgi:hypothetical protein
MTLSALGIFSAAGAGVVSAGSYELISTTILGSSATSVTFSSLGTYSADYKHLQLRYAGSLTGTSWIGLNLNETLSGVNNYARHELTGNGSSVSSAGGVYPAMLLGVHGTTAGAMIVDILDAYSSTKRKTVRTLSGAASSIIQLTSGIRTDDITAVSSLYFRPDSGSFATGSRFSLYGIKG